MVCEYTRACVCLSVRLSILCLPINDLFAATENSFQLRMNMNITIRDRYDLDFGTMSTEKSSKAARIAPLAKPALPLVMKQLLDQWESSAVAPGSYTPDIAAVKKQTTKTPVWRESSSSSSVCAAKETDDMPGPVRTLNASHV
jgi:hypothetical protein